MEGYEKTEKLKLNKLEGSNVVDIEAVQENFEILDNMVGNIDLTDTQITCTAKENQKLNEVLAGVIAYIEELPTFMTNSINMITMANGGDTFENLLKKIPKKGEILPQDVKGNSDKRLYKYINIANSSSDNPYLWVEYINDKGENVTNKYYLKDLKLVKDIKEKNESLEREVGELKSMIESNNNEFKRLNSILRGLVGDN